MSETDGALISHLDDLQARLSRVAALSTPVDVVVGSARSSPARALETRAAQSPRPTPRSPVASPALEGRAAYHQTRYIVPRRAKRRHELPSKRELGGSETTRRPPSTFTTRRETRHDTTATASAEVGLLFSKSPAATETRAGGVRAEGQKAVSASDAPSETPVSDTSSSASRVVGGGSERSPHDAAATVAELDATRARLVDAESRLRAARRDNEVLAERLRLAGEAEAARAARVAAIVEDAERVALEATRVRLGRSGNGDDEKRVTACNTLDATEPSTVSLASRAAAARVAAAEARGEATRLVSALGADPELANGLVRRLGEVSWLVADLAAVAEA